MKKWYIVLFSFFVSFLLISIFAFEISPFYTEPPSNDSAVFYITGKCWMQGYLPYKDIWELKGPLIFLYNGIGYILTKSLLGVYILQLLVVSLSVYLTICFFKLEFTKKCSLILSAIVCIQSSCIGLGGNNLETFLLPFLLLSFYYLYKWSDSVANIGVVTHRPVYAALYGFVLGFCLMSRLTNAIGVCAAVAVVAVTLLLHREWKNLILNIFFFLLGFLVIVIPFVAYFDYHGLLHEMWYGTLLFGLEYATSSGFEIISLKGLANIALRFVDNYMLISVSLLLLICSNKRKYVGLMWFVISCTTFIWFLKSNGFEHYVIIAIPYAIVSFIELSKLYKEYKVSIYKYLFRSSVLAYMVLAIVGCTYTMWLYKTLYSFNKELFEIRSITKNLPLDYKKSFVVYNLSPQIYVYDDIIPATKFHSLQDFVISMGPSIKGQVREEFVNKRIEWLLVKKGKTNIDDIIRKEYIREKEVEQLTLYRHK